MKKFLALVICIWISSCGLLAAYVIAAEEKTEFGTYLGWGAEMDAQYKFILNEVFNYLIQELGGEAEYVNYTSRKEFFEFAGRKGPKFAIVGYRAELVHLIRDYDFTPVVSYSFMGRKKNRACLYVKKDSGIEQASQLKGRNISTYGGPFGYCLLNNMLDERPDAFFNNIEMTTSGLEAIYMISLQVTEAAFATDQVMAFLKKHNRSAVRDLQKLSCSGTYTFLPLLSKDVPPEMVKEILPLLNKVARGEAMAQYQGVILLHELKFMQVDEEDFEWDVAIYTEAEKNGCVESYERWRERVENAESKE